MKLSTLGLTAILLTPLSAEAQVLITEVQPNPTSDNDDGEWVELQNIGASPVSIDGWTLNDYTGSDPAGEVTTRWAFPAGTTLAAGQVIVVAKFASPSASGSTNGYSANTPAGLYAMPASFELGGSGHDEPSVPNLVASGGTTSIALTNSGGGDALVLRNAMGTVVSGIEWGTVERSVFGPPITAVAGSGASFRRIANTGSSAADFEVAATPDPFTGFTGGAPAGPPIITGTTETPRHLGHAQSYTVATNAADSDGVSSVELFTAIATSSTGPASGAYTSAAMTHGSGNSWSLSLTPSTGAAPATFHDRYVRGYVRATDATSAATVDPVNATSAAGNSAYFWRNVMPPTESSIAEVRAVNGDGSLRWIRHSAMVRGIALTRTAAFLANKTNFYIMSESSNDAIRVFSSVLVPQTVNPGDVVRVTGMLDSYNGLRQIGEPEVAVEVLSSGANVPVSTHTVADLLANGEQLESQLVYVTGLSFATAQTNWPTNGNVDVTDGTGTIAVRVTTGVADLTGAAAPTGSFALRGILAQFAANGVGGYQITPRGLSDVVTGGPQPDAGPRDSGASDTGVADTGVHPDAGTTDTGTRDSGGETDSGSVEHDSGTVEHDSGTVEHDAGVEDSGSTGTDAGVVGDSGAGHPDATTTRTDAGVVDGGRRPSSSGSGSSSSGCTCVAERASAPTAGAAWAFGLLGLAVLGRRRKR